MFFLADLPPEIPIAEVRIICSIEAAEHYDIPVEIMYAVAVTEGGSPGAVNVNANGTRDLGYLQFNTAYLQTLEPYGVTAELVQKNSCYPFYLAAWRLRGHLQEPGDDPYTKAAYYHSRKPEYNAMYRDRLYAAAQTFDYGFGAKFLKLMSDKLAAMTAELVSHKTR